MRKVLTDMKGAPPCSFCGHDISTRKLVFVEPQEKKITICDACVMGLMELISNIEEMNKIPPGVRPN